MTCDSAYRLQSYAWSRPNVVSVLIGYRFLEKIVIFSDFTCTVGIAKFFAKISYYVANAFVSFFWNLAILFSSKFCSQRGSDRDCWEPPVCWSESGCLPFEKADCLTSSVWSSTVLVEDKELCRDLAHDRPKSEAAQSAARHGSMCR